MTAFPNSRLVKKQFGFFRKKKRKKQVLLDDWSTLKLPPLPSQNAQGSAFTPELKQKTFGLRRNRPAGSPCVSRVHYVIGALMAAGKKKKTLAGSEH